ncbi:MAG: hypothetical protein U0Q16_13665 [Bryobacteraceae bacterium]
MDDRLAVAVTAARVLEASGQRYALIGSVACEALGLPQDPAEEGIRFAVENHWTVTGDVGQACAEGRSGVFKWHGIALREDFCIRLYPAYRCVPRDLLDRAVPIRINEALIRIAEPGDLLLEAALREGADLVASIHTGFGPIDWDRVEKTAHKMCPSLPDGKGEAFLECLHLLKSTSG